MVLSLSQFDTDLGNILADMPESMDFPVGGASYTVNRVSMSMINWEQRKREVVQKTRVIVSLKISDFISPLVPPDINNLVTYDGATMLVLDTGESPEGQELRLFLGGQFSQ